MMLIQTEQRLMPGSRGFVYPSAPDFGVGFLCAVQWYRKSGLGVILCRVKLILEVEPTQGTGTALWFFNSSTFYLILLVNVKGKAGTGCSKRGITKKSGLRNSLG